MIPVRVALILSAIGGSIVFRYVPLRDLKELRAEIIHSVWCVGLKRELTRQEIVQLCSVR